MKVLLIGSSFSAAPMLFDLKKRGAQIIVAGKYRNDPCHAYADTSLYVDYSDASVLRDACSGNAFDAIVPSCNDYAYASATRLASDMGYPGFDTLETTEILHEKDHFRRFCAAIGVSAPRVYGEFTEVDQQGAAQIPGPALVKPVDSFSGRGIEHVRRKEALPAALGRAMAQSRSKRVVVEQFVEGSLHSHTAFVAAGQIVWHDFVDEYCTVYPYQVDQSFYPSHLSGPVRQRVNDSMAKVVSELGLADGLLHTQFIADGEDFWIIECMRRCPGDLYGHHFMLASGMDYVHEYVSGFLGIAPTAPKATRPMQPVKRQVISVASPVPLFGVSIGTGSHAATFIPLKESGEELGVAPFDKAGILFVAGQQQQDPRNAFEKVYSGVVGLE